MGINQNSDLNGITFNLLCITLLAYEEHRAFHVSGPTTPSTSNDLSFWNCVTAFAVSGPNFPSAVPASYPFSNRRRCRFSTFGPEDPTRNVSEEGSQVSPGIEAGSAGSEVDLLDGTSVEGVQGPGNMFPEQLCWGQCPPDSYVTYQ